MRIAYVINSLEGGGAAFPVPAITSVFREAGHTVKVFALARRDGLAIPLCEKAGLEYCICPYGEKQPIRMFLWLRRALRAWQPDLIWTSLTRSTAMGALIGILERKPVVSWQHSAFLKAGNLRLLRALRNTPRIWVGDSEYVTEVTRQRLDLPDARMACWPIFCVRTDVPQAAPWQPGEVIRIASLGRFSPEKGYDELIDALVMLRGRDLPAFEVTICGRGKERERLEAKKRALGLDNLHLHDFVHDVPDFLATQHLYVQPSHWEGFCVAVHDAMQAGLPVIGTAVGELNHSLQEGRTGWKVPPRDAAALAECMARVLSRPAELHATGCNARAYVREHFSHTNFTRIGRDILHRAMPGRA